jgi:hypothetical protein
MKLTASTMTTASISTCTNSLTDPTPPSPGSGTGAARCRPAARRGSVGRHRERLAHLDDVAALGHRDAQRDHFLALVAHLDLRRIDVGALDLGDVAELEAGAIGADRQNAQLIDRIELPAHAHLHEVGGVR